MALQVKVPGVSASKLLAGPSGKQVAARLAEAAHKLHAANVVVDRRHGLSDELRILHERLPTVAESYLGLAGRISRLLGDCDVLVERLHAAGRDAAVAGIHRDFYPDQVLVDGDGDGRLYVLDFDLYCMGDPLLDVGNCLAHITEQALRTTGDPAGLSRQERAMFDRYKRLSRNPASCDAIVPAYYALSLARHVWISTVIADRRTFTERLLALSTSALRRALTAQS
jgi:aminoglycoside phosphotransferase (APT) family kinase protein